MKYYTLLALLLTTPSCFSLSLYETLLFTLASVGSSYLYTYHIDENKTESEQALPLATFYLLLSADFLIAGNIVQDTKYISENIKNVTHLGLQIAAGSYALKAQHVLYEKNQKVFLDTKNIPNSKKIIHTHLLRTK